MSEELKACPFCKFADEAILGGGHPRPGLRACAEASDARDRYWWIECDNCLCHGPVARDESDARREWNTRAQSPAFGTAGLLAIASEMEHEAASGRAYDPREVAARIRAACSPEAVAFFEAAKEWCAIIETDAPTKGMATLATVDWAQYLIRLKDAYRAMAAQEKGEG